MYASCGSGYSARCACTTPACRAVPRCPPRTSMATTWPRRSPRWTCSHVFAAGWAWASGGIVSTPRDTNAFIRAYVRGATTSPSARTGTVHVQGRKLRAARPGQELGRPGDIPLPDPVRNGLRPYREYPPGYTQFVAASKNGKRSVVVSDERADHPGQQPGQVQGTAADRHARRLRSARPVRSTGSAGQRAARPG